MKTQTELDKLLKGINRKSYPAYKSLQGVYQFDGYQLDICHVQGDPFAAPSKLSVYVKKEQAGFPEQYYSTGYKNTALCDHLTRLFGQAVKRYTLKAEGSGKSGLISISRCGQEILKRTAAVIKDGNVLIRFEAGFPAFGRTINAEGLREILFSYLPEIVSSSLYYKNLGQTKIKSVIELSEDQHVLRKELKKRKLAAFVANGAILPRESGVSQKPMKNAIPFKSPESMEVIIDLPYKGSIKGMGIPEGITLVAGGGYHGKSTLLKALEQGIYNHIAGDGREYVASLETAVKIRAEDGRAVSHVNISPFINNLPNGKDTTDFSTENASGSTSQAANVAEAVQAGADVLLIDEDTCATNFMDRDALMQEVISGKHEPITPFIMQARKMYEEHGISIIIVAGSSGSYFYIADKIIQMDNYNAYDITGKVKELLNRRENRCQSQEVPVPVNILFNGDKRVLKVKKADRKRGQVKIKQSGKDSFLIGKETVDIKYVEQIMDYEQTTTLSYCLKALIEQMEIKGADAVNETDSLLKQIQEKGLESLCPGAYLPVYLAQVRKQDILSCLNRYRGIC
ncbi:MAG: ABC-ATPase domain-containing protein [Lachnospiraceae bacterium]